MKNEKIMFDGKGYDRELLIQAVQTTYQDMIEDLWGIEAYAKKEGIPLVMKND